MRAAHITECVLCAARARARAFGIGRNFLWLEKLHYRNFRSQAETIKCVLAGICIVCFNGNGKSENKIVALDGRAFRAARLSQLHCFV